MKSIRLWLLLLMCATQFVSGMPKEVVEKFTELDAKLQDSPARVIEFIEARHFPFRRLPVKMSGVARVSDQAGVSLEYPEKRNLVIVDSKGVLMRKFTGSDEVREKLVDTADSTTAVLLKNLFEFDHKELARLFVAEWIEVDVENWAIDLQGMDEADLDLDSVMLRGKDAQLLEIEIYFSKKRWIGITPQSETVLDSFSAAELKRYFRSQVN